MGAGSDRLLLGFARMVETVHRGFISIEYNRVWAHSIVLGRFHLHKLFSKVSHYVFLL